MFHQIKTYFGMIHARSTHHFYCDYYSGERGLRATAHFDRIQPWSL